jgi:aldose 1-epimerase
LKNRIEFTMTCSQFDVATQVQLHSELWQAVALPELGGNLISLTHRPSGLNVLRTPKHIDQLKCQPERYGIPVLFPPNRIAGGTFTFEDRVYTFPINDPLERQNHLHGIVLRQSWDVIQQSTTHVVMQYCIEATSGFPHDCRLQLAYELDGEGLSQRMTVINDSQTNMPLGLGYHTAFAMTAGSQVLPTVTGKQWEIVPPQMLPSGRLMDVPDGTLPFSDQQAAGMHCPIADGEFAGQALRGTVITHPTLKQAVVYRVDEQYKHWYFWNEGGGQGFFCAEPLTWIANAMNMPMEREVTGVQVLAPQASWSATSQISLVSHV